VRHHQGKLKLQFEHGILTLEGQKHQDQEVVTHGLYEQAKTRDVSCFACNTRENQQLYGCHDHP
jgi:hypothetical protein